MRTIPVVFAGVCRGRAQLPISRFVRAATILLLMAAALPAIAASPVQIQRESIKAMESSIDQQRKSILHQVDYSKADASGFFSFAWPRPPAAPPDPACAPIPVSRLQDYIDEVAKKEGVTPDLLRAVIGTESAFQPCAVSSKGAQGLMQLMPATAAELGVTNPFDPKENIGAGARYLSHLLERYGGDLALALGAYNAGPALVDTYKGLPPLPETMNYVADIMKKLRRSTAGSSEK